MSYDDETDDDDGPAFDLDPAMLARAEQAIAAHGDGFRNTVERRITDMTRLTDSLAAPAETGDEIGVWEALFEHGHELAGQGGTFGYPLLSEIGRSLCGFVDGSRAVSASGDIAVLRAHIAAVTQAVGANPADAAENRAILAALQTLVRRHMA